MDDLSNVLWIGGPAGAGKTTVARLLARRHGLRWYNSDARTWIHRDRALAAGVALPPRGPGQAFYDRRPMILSDLRELPAAPLVVAEGGQMTPAMASLGGSAIWLMPSRDEQRRRLAARHPDGAPDAYLRSWDVVREQLDGSGVAELPVDGLSVDETLAELEVFFEPRLTAGPVASTLEERQDLVRYANQAIITQCLSPSTKPLNPLPPAQIVRDFECECGRADCLAQVTLRAVDAQTLAAAPPPAILAPGHG
ncbi:P-loop nucleotide/nucleoside kinase family protein [Flindersiella endophytica]